MSYIGAHPASVGGMAIKWAVNSFVAVLFFAIMLASPLCTGISYSRGLGLTGGFALVLHGLVIWLYSRSVKWPFVDSVSGERAVKALEYTVSIVSWVLQFLLWQHGAADATFAFLFLPTYFATSLMAFHICFGYFARRSFNKITLLFLAANIWTIARYFITIFKIHQQMESQ